LRKPGASVVCGNDTLAYRLADGLALLERDDVANMDAALRAHEMNAELRIVVRMFNTSLGAGLAQRPYCTVLSDMAMAAPAFVAAAAGESTPVVRLRDDTLLVADRRAVPDGDVVCGLAVTEGRTEPELLPADQITADVVVARVRRRAWARGSRAPCLPHHYPIRAVLARVWRRVRLILGVFAGLLLVGAVVLAWARDDVSWWEAAYLSMLVSFGGASADLGAATVEQVTHAVLRFASIALIRC
jgi:hypothetical protein